MAPIPGSKWLRTKSESKEMKDTLAAPGANISLVLGKYLTWAKLEPEKRILELETKKEPMKKRHFENVAGLKPPISKSFYEYLQTRRERMFGPSKTFFLKTQARLAINLGCESILENHISLHPLYGFPVLPGSAIKGVTRHYIMENDRASEAEITLVFGLSSGDAGPGVGEGQVVFLDAWPRTLDQFQSKLLELDIMTCHFQNYYRTKGRVDPSDTDNPNPVVFLVVKKDVEFQFSLGLSAWGRRSLQGAAAAALLDKVTGWMTEALKEYGIGAKTGSGYGWFAD